MKKMYQTPTMNVVEIEVTQMIANSVTSVSSNLDVDDAINYGGGSNQAARVKSNTVDWDEWE
jgi:hypothetical protein